MAKKVMGEDGKMYKVKKPIYKRVWFWIVIVIIVIAVGGSLGKDKESSNGGQKIDSQTSNSSSAKSENEEKKYYAVGDTVEVGDAIYTLNSVTLTDERNQFDESNPNYVIAVSYTMENKGDTDLPVGMDLSAYGPDDKKLETYANDNTLGSVATGKKMDCTQHFGLNELGDVELQFAPAISLKKTADFKVNVQ